MHFDAHPDTWDTYFGQPHLHLTPARRAAGPPGRRAAEEGLLDPGGCVHAGIRGGLYGAADMDDDRALGFLAIRCHEVHIHGVQPVLERIRARVHDRPVYVSVDIDVLDPAFAPGTGTPEAGGLASWQLLHLLRELAPLNHVGGDIVEVAPAYGHAAITGVAAAHICYELLSAWAPRPGLEVEIAFPAASPVEGLAISPRTSGQGYAGWLQRNGCSVMRDRLHIDVRDGRTAGTPRPDGPSARQLPALATMRSRVGLVTEWGKASVPNRGKNRRSVCRDMPCS